MLRVILISDTCSYEVCCAVLCLKTKNKNNRAEMRFWMAGVLFRVD